jgi:hypothetical protein
VMLPKDGCRESLASPSISIDVVEPAAPTRRPVSALLGRCAMHGLLVSASSTSRAVLFTHRCLPRIREMLSGFRANHD